MAISEEDLLEEKSHLKVTQQTIQQEMDNEQKTLSSIVQSDPRSVDDHEIWHAVNAQKAQIEKIQSKLMTYEQWSDCPYFGRMDLVGEEQGEDQFEESCYIGQRTIKGYDGFIAYDWRSPTCQLYFLDNQTDFSHNDIQYNLKLKRKIDIDKGDLLSVENQFICGSEFDQKGITDPFLMRVLERKRQQPGLSDIISTIQQEQYKIITCPVEQSFVVQGCAGSGKTMVLLHRLSYLMFNVNTISWDRVRVITPNEIFNVFINDLAKQLDLDQINRLTVEQLYEGIIREHYQSDFTKKYILGDEKTLPVEYRREISSIDFFNNISNAVCMNAIEQLQGCITPVLQEFVQKSGYKDLFESPLPKMIMGVEKVIGLFVEEQQNLGRQLQKLYSQQKAAQDALDRIDTEKEEFYFLQQQWEIDGKPSEYLKYWINVLAPTINEINFIQKEIEKTGDIFLSKKTTLETQLKQLEQKISELKARGTTELGSLEYHKKQFQSELQAYEIGGAEVEKYNKEVREWTELHNEEQEKYFSLFNDSSLNFNSAIASEHYVLLNLQYRDTLDSENQKEAKNASSQSRKKANEESLNRARKEIESVKELLLDSEQISIVNQSRNMVKQLASNTYRGVVEKNLMQCKQKYCINEVKSQIVYRHELLYYTVVLYQLYGASPIPLHLLCIDEGQDLYPIEYIMLNQLMDEKCTFNVFGDLNQQLEERLSVSSWDKCIPFPATYYTLNENYRNTVQITSYVNQVYEFTMQTIGLSGCDVKIVNNNTFLEMFREFICASGTKAIIALSKNCFDEIIAYKHASSLVDEVNFDFVKEQELDFSHINFFSIAEVKGLEFDTVFVITKDMSRNQRYIAATRALSILYVYND